MRPTIFGLTLAAALGSAVVAGVFWAFSTFVMDALDRIAPGEAVAAMSAINVTVMRPGFMIPFVATAALSVVLAVHAVVTFGDDRATVLLIGSALYVVATFLLTGAMNVPLNDALAKVDPSSAGVADAWGHFFDRWMPWNHVRTLAALGAAAAFIVALTL
jgi:uncharacterized membrane protein